jgi:hypothetical protein
MNQMDASALEGCVLRVDEGLVAHPERPGVVGHLELSAGAAADLELVRRLELRQEAGSAADALFVAAPTPRAGGGLEVLRPARRIVVAEDVAAADEALVAAQHAGAPGLQFYPHLMAPERGNALLQSQGRFQPPPASPPPGTWPPPGWAPPPALAERDRRRAARRKRGLPEFDPADDLEQQALTDLRPGPGAPWGTAGRAPLPPQWRALPGAAGGKGGGGGGGEDLGDVEKDVSVSYVYG